MDGAPGTGPLGLHRPTAMAVCLVVAMAGCILPIYPEERSEPFLAVEAFDVHVNETLVWVNLTLRNVAGETLLKSDDYHITLRLDLDERMTLYPGVQQQNGSVIRVEQLGPGAETGWHGGEWAFARVYPASAHEDAALGNHSLGLFYAESAQSMFWNESRRGILERDVAYVPPLPPNQTMSMSFVMRPENPQVTGEDLPRTYTGNAGLYHVSLESVRILEDGFQDFTEHIGCFNADTPVFLGFRDDGPDCPVFNAKGDFSINYGPGRYPPDHQLNWTL